MAASLLTLVRPRSTEDEQVYRDKGRKTKADFETRTTKYAFYAFFAVDHLFSDSVLQNSSEHFKYLWLGLLYQSGFLSDLFHGSMLLAYFSEKFFWRRVILDYA